METKRCFRRILAVLAVLALLAGAVSWAAAEETVLYESDFSKGTDGWYTWDPCQLSVKSKALGIKGRVESWNSPRRDFPLTAGVTYFITVEVCQKQQASATLMLSAAHSKNGKTTYENIVRVQVQKGKWTTMEAEWTPGAFDDYTLYVETVDSPTLSYEIRNFRVVSGYTAAARMLKEYNGLSKKLKKRLESLRNAMYPDFMTVSPADYSAWIPQIEEQELAAITEVKLEDGVFSLQMERKVDEISITEVTSNGSWAGSYSTWEDMNNPERGLRAALTLKNPKRNKVDVSIQERITVNKKDYYYYRYYTLDRSGPSLEPTSTRVTCPGNAKDYPPLNKVKNAQVYLSLERRADGSVSSFGYSLETKGYANLEIGLDEDGKMESGRVYKAANDRDGVYDLEMRMNGEHRVNYLTFRPDNSLSFTALILPQDSFGYYREMIRKAYPGANLYTPDFDVWIYYFFFGQGETEHYFLTRDELFTVDENGVVRLNEEARDINGEPFQDAAIRDILDPVVYIFPAGLAGK